MKNRRLIGVGVASLVAVAIGSAYLVGRARASGAPQAQPLTYSGVLTDTAGVPLSGSKNIQVQIWDKDTAGNIVCTTGSAAQTLSAGSFSVVLPAPCVAAVRTTPDLWTEVLVDGASAGRTKMGAVPYALEADSASNAGGALATRLANIEAGNVSVHDTAGTPLRICSGSTPIGNTNWQLYNGGPQVFVTVDTSACKFTKRPLYLPVLAGSSSHWQASGGSAPYTVDATAATQFQIFIYFGTAGTTPAAANTNNWHIEWIAIGS